MGFDKRIPPSAKWRVKVRYITKDEFAAKVRRAKWRPVTKTGQLVGSGGFDGGHRVNQQRERAAEDGAWFVKVRGKRSQDY